MIGGTEPGAANVIAFNSGSGVQIEQGGKFNPPTGTTTYLGGFGNAIRRNSIFANSQSFSLASPSFPKWTAGIDLLDSDQLNSSSRPVAVNDPRDADSGPNNLQNYPALSSAIGSNGTLTVTGRLDSTANTTFEVDFFSNEQMDLGGFG